MNSVTTTYWGPCSEGLQYGAPQNRRQAKLAATLHFCGKSFPGRYLSIALALLTVASSASGSPAQARFDAFWVWNRSTPLADHEIRALRTLGTTKLFWHVGELDCRSGHWFWRSRIALPRESAIQVVPVLRLDPHDREPFTASARTELALRLREFATENQIAELELDYDCPDRLFADYADALGQLKTWAPHVSATALAHWIHLPRFSDFAQNLSEIAPMFYDLRPDSVNRAPQPLPLLDSQQFGVDLAAWNNCPRPWRAGLPNFCRVSVYDGSAKLRGHLRSWNWNDVCFNPALSVVVQSPGVTLLRASGATSIGDTPIASGDWISVRQPEREALAAALCRVAQTKAIGVGCFRMPDNSDPSGWSLLQLQDLAQAKATLSLRYDGEQFVLVNASDADLPPRFGTRDDSRGYALEVDAPAPIWRDASAGEFWRVGAHRVHGSDATASAIPLATRLTFWFSNLRAGATLRSGIIELAPHASLSTIRYRLLSAGDEIAPWRQLQ